MNRLNSSPSSVQSYGKVISEILADATNNAATLADKPDDELALTELQNDLKALSNQMALVSDFISVTLGATTNFSKSMPDMAAQLQSIADKAIQASGADQKKLDQLNNDVDQLRDHVNGLTSQITWFKAGISAEVTIGVGVFSAGWLIGIIAALVIAAIIAAEEGVIKIDSGVIKADQLKIKDDIIKLQRFEADVAALNLLSANYSRMAGQVSQMESALTEVSQQWSTLQDDVNAAIADINDALSDAQADKYPDVLKDLHQASAAWLAIDSIAGSLAINVNVSDAKITSDMSQDDVKAAIASSKVVSMVEYFNQPATS